MSDAGSGLFGSVGAQLDELRANPGSRWLATAAGVAIGLAVAWQHWLGFVLGGALVALAQESIPRGLLAGLGFGVLAWLVFASSLARSGDFGLYLNMGQVLLVSTAIPIAGALLGSIARGVR